MLFASLQMKEIFQLGAKSSRNWMSKMIGQISKSSGELLFAIETT